MAERDDIITRVAETLKEPVTLSGDLNERIMAAVRAEPAPTRRPQPKGGGVVRWLRRPAIQLSPLGGLAAAAIVAAVGVGVGRLLAPVSAGPATSAPMSPATAGAATATTIEFVLVAPTAQTVSLVGDFNDWDVAATPLRPVPGDGVWSVTVPLAPGRYRYSFLVDGTTWLQDPNGAPALEDEFGRPNSVVTIGGAL